MSNLELMQSLLNFWEQDKTFEKSIQHKSSALQYKFFDGPPFVSGTPHYGHLLAGSIKDVIPRYMAMRGYQVKRKRGWDCHGLPVEKAVEKELGIDGKKDIEEKIWIETFVEACRKYVNQTSTDWKWFVDHTGRWADIENPYFTMDLDFMESVMRCFSSIYNQNRVYKGFKVQGYCPSCGTPLSNSEISEGYADRQDSAITVKFSLHNSNIKNYSASEDGFVDVVAGVIKDSEGRYAMIHHAKENLWFFPGGKVEKGECRIAALKRELKEEVGIEVSEKDYLGAVKIIHLGKPWRVHWFEVKTNDIPSIQETEKHNSLVWVKEEKSENELGFALNIEGNIIDDARELTQNFIDFHLFKNVLNPEEKGLIEGSFNFLAWTTTPWTLPSNMFLAVGEDIDYVTLYDPNAQEYFVLAENLVHKYFKSPEQYQFIYRQKGKELKNLSYTPLFDFIKHSQIAPVYQEQFFQVQSADFVSTDDGTGIVHIAPGFGEDDFTVVANLLWSENALEWLFMPVDEYGCFDQQVPSYQGMKVMESNKAIIDELKTQQKIVKIDSLMHSYPHCWRCKTPLIYKAMSSWFIKEKEMNALTSWAAEQINFTPATVKNRFVNGLQQAPDWNVARNRYWGSPLPIWQNIDDNEDHFSISTLDELYHLSRTGSKNLTKNLFIRHGRTDFNEVHHFDGLGDARLNALGQEQAEGLVARLKPHLDATPDPIFIISPLPRTWQTIKPSLIAYFGAEETERCEKLYFAHYEAHRARFLAKEAKEYIKNSDDNALVIRLNDQLFIDNRITDLVSYASQNLPIKCDAFNRFDESKPVGLDWEDLQEYFERNKRAVLYWNTHYPTRTLIYISHDDTIRLMRKVFRDFAYGKYRPKYKVNNAEIKLHYRDNDRNTEVDLHKPYVDNYRGIKDGKTYKRIPEVLDCWFESGSMPFGQDHYLGEGSSEISYPADFIAEGLDQTRWWFRSLHVVGHAIKGENAFKNVVVNGLILAEDGKKMSKSLKNYPDPRTLIEKRGGDAFRLYTLSSPVVRAEPLRFSEKGVEQAFKDFNLPLENVFKFFETYAKIDQWKADQTQLFGLLDSSTSVDKQTLLESLVRIQADVIISQNSAWAEQLATILEEGLRKKVEIQIVATFDQLHEKIITQFPGKNCLILANEEALLRLWQHFYQASDHHIQLQEWEILPLPNYHISHELDRRILAEYHQCLQHVDHGLKNYNLDGAIRIGIDFMEKLSNWYLRRSRRRFWESGMSTDKHSAYSTLYSVLSGYLQIMAPFAPFITDALWQKLAPFRQQQLAETSIHLSHRPFAHASYIDQQLMNEISMVRRAIKLALFIRSKNKIAVKQPLQSMEIKFE